MIKVFKNKMIAYGFSSAGDISETEHVALNKSNNC